MRQTQYHLLTNTGRDFTTFSLKIQMSHTKSSRCAICFGTNAVISPDKQNNDRKVWLSDCLSLTRSIFVLLTPLKQCINLNWPLTNLNHVSHSHLLMSSQIKHHWSFPFFINGDRHIFPHKNACGLKDWDYCCNCFSNFKVFFI